MTYQSIDQLEVALDFGNTHVPVGKMIKDKRQVWFEYSQVCLDSGINISPFNLNFETGAQVCNDQAFEGLFGVFNDSLPDGWGRLLLDRQAMRSGIAYQRLTALDRLSVVGESGMGALVYKPVTGEYQDTIADIDLDKIAKESAIVLAGNSDEFFEELLRLNGSSCGARPKIAVKISPDKKIIQTQDEDSNSELEDWLIKFPSQSDQPDIGAIEYAYSLMAKAAGINMPETHLFETQKGGRYFAIKRFDRVAGQRLHLHSLCGLLHADYRVPSLDYSDAINATYKLTKNKNDMLKHYRLAVFNVLAHNRDDHSKNFSYLMDSCGQWSLAPAYDLVFSYGPGGEQSMTVMGAGREPSIKHLLALADHLAISNPQEIIDDVQAVVSRWSDFAKSAGVSQDSIKLIAKTL